MSRARSILISLKILQKYVNSSGRLHTRYAILDRMHRISFDLRSYALLGFYSTEGAYNQFDLCNEANSISNPNETTFAKEALSKPPLMRMWCGPHTQH